MFNFLSILIHIINSIFSGLYISQFLKSKHKKKVTVILWSIIYFMAQMVIFEVIQSRYPFNDVVSVTINVLLIVGMQRLFFRKGASSQLFVCFSFVAGKEIVKYIASVLNVALGTVTGKWLDALIMQGQIVANNHVELVTNVMLYVMYIASAILYALILGIAYFFHLLCIKSDFGEWPLMGRGQPDINQYPLSFSYLYIFSFWLFNTMIVLLSVRSDIVDAYLQMYDSFIGTIVSLF